MRLDVPPSFPVSIIYVYMHDSLRPVKVLWQIVF